MYFSFGGAVCSDCSLAEPTLFRQLALVLTGKPLLPAARVPAMKNNPREQPPALMGLKNLITCVELPSRGREGTDCRPRGTCKWELWSGSCRGRGERNEFTAFLAGVYPPLLLLECLDMTDSPASRPVHVFKRISIVNDPREILSCALHGVRKNRRPLLLFTQIVRSLRPQTQWMRLCLPCRRVLGTSSLLSKSLWHAAVVAKIDEFATHNAPLSTKETCLLPRWLHFRPGECTSGLEIDWYVS